MCGGGGGGDKNTQPVGNIPELTEKQLQDAVTLPTGFTAKPVAGKGDKPGTYVIYDPSGDVYSSTSDFGGFVAAANQVNQLAGSTNSLYNPETNTFINATTGKAIVPSDSTELSSTGMIGGRTISVPGASDDIAGITELAYGLASEGVTLPDQMLAELTPDQLAAFDLARAGIGSYQPYLDRATDLTDQGIAALQKARRATLDLAGQIPGQVERGQASLDQAAAQVLAAAQSSDPATRLAARELMASSDRVGQLAARTAANARALQSPMEERLLQATGGARGFAEQGISGAQTAAERARLSTSEAQRSLSQAAQMGRETAMQGIAQLAGTGRMFDPRTANAFMNEYENAAVDAALSDIARQGLLQEQELAARAVQSGAYGGGREAIARAELGRNVLEQQAKTAAQMRAAGSESAAQRAQQAFEQAQSRQQNVAQLTGQLGQVGVGAAAQAAEAGGRLGLSAEELAQTGALQGAQIGLSSQQLAAANAQSIAQTGLNIEQLAAQTGLSATELAAQFAAEQARLAQSQAQIGMQGAQSAGNLGLQSANLGLAGITQGLGAQQQAAGMGQGIAGLGQQYLGLGQAGQQFGLQDINTLLNIGQIQQRQNQAGYDTAYNNAYRQAMQPYQNLAFLSDIVTGAPSGQASTMTQPGPSTGSQLLGTAMAIPYIYQGWQGMTNS